MFERKFNFFEKLLLPVGIGITFFGFYMILLAERVNTDVAWIRLTTLFTWMLLLFVIIFTSASENMKEELTVIQKEHMTEIKLLRELSHEQLEEIKLLRKEISGKKK